MDINIKGKLQNKLIEEGDLVIDSISPEESVAMLVVKNSDSDYNIVVFDNEFKDEEEVFINHYFNITEEELQQNYRLVAKAKDVKITIEY